MTSTIFLRRLLALDALSCAATGLSLALFAGTLSPVFGLPEAVVGGAGMILLPFAALLTWLAARPFPARPMVLAVIAANLLWSVESIILLAQHGGGMTALGTMFVAGQAAAVLGLACLQYLALRRAAQTA